jgi:hypothetical protein
MVILLERITTANAKRHDPRDATGRPRSWLIAHREN